MERVELVELVIKTKNSGHTLRLDHRVNGIQYQLESLGTFYMVWAFTEQNTYMSKFDDISDAVEAYMSNTLSDFQTANEEI